MTYLQILISVFAISAQLHWVIKNAVESAIKSTVEQSVISAIEYTKL